MASIYSLAKDLVASIAIFVELIAKYFTMPLSEIVDTAPEGLRIILEPIMWLIDLLTWGDVTILNIMFTVGVNLWIIFALYRFFKGE